MTAAAELLIEVKSIHEKALAGLTQIQKQLVHTEKANQLVAQSTVGAKKALDDLATGMAKTKQSTEQLTGTARNLQSTIRELTTGMLGNSVAAIAVGTAIGNVAVQMAGQLLNALVSATTQFSALHNQLTLVAGIGTSAADSMQVIQQAAVTSSSSIADLTQRYQALVAAYQGSAIPLTRVNELFQQQESAITAIQQVTLAGSMSRLLDETGKTVLAFDQLFGISNLLIGALETVRVVMQGMADLANIIQRSMPGHRDPSGIIALLQDEGTLTLQLQVYQSELQRIQMSRIQAGREYNSRLGDEAQLTRNIEETTRRITELRAKSDLAEVRRIATQDRIAEQLKHEIDNMRLTAVQQEIRNRMLQIELQFRQAGLTVAQASEAAAAMRIQVESAALAGQFQSLRDSLMTREQLELQSFERRMQMLTDFRLRGLATEEEFNTMVLQEFFRTNMAMREIQQQTASHLINVQMATGQQLVTLLQILGGKSKAAAIAAIGVNTALQIAQAIQNTAAAATRAMAELGPIAGPPMAASIQAWGNAQIGLIAAAGAMNMAGAAGRGSGGGPGLSSPIPNGGGTDDGGMPPTRIVIEPVDPAMIFTGEQLNNLIGAINEQAENGSTIVATKLL